MSDTPSTNTLSAALSAVLNTFSSLPRLLALGEPAHHLTDPAEWRNRIFEILVQEHGFRSIALESDAVAGLRVQHHLDTAEGEREDTLQHGFSHGFGQVPANQALIDWIKTHNGGRSEKDRVRFYGFDAPTESMWAPSPRQALLVLHDHLSGWLPHLPVDQDTLLGWCGEDTLWSNPAAARDPGQSVGNTARARELRLVTDDLLTLLETEGTRLQVDGDELWHLRLHGRAAQGLLRYHHLMADPAPDRIGRLLTLRGLMMAENLSAIQEREASRGPTLVFAHNQHLIPQVNHWTWGGSSLAWCPAGVRLQASLGEAYRVIATTGPARQADALLPAGLYPTPAVLSWLPEQGTLETGWPFTLKPQVLQHTDGVLCLPGLPPPGA